MTLILIAYVVAAFYVTTSYVSLAQGLFVPKLHMNTDYMMGVVAVFGSLLTPDVIVWQTSSRRGIPRSVAQAHRDESHAEHLSPA